MADSPPQKNRAELVAEWVLTRRVQLYGLLRRDLGRALSEDDIDDVLVDTWLALHKSPFDPSRPEAFAYAATTARHLARRRLPTALHRDADEELAELVPDWAAADPVLAIQLRSCWDALSRLDQDALFWSVMVGLDVPALAETLGVGIDAAAKRVTRARARMRACVEGS